MQRFADQCTNLNGQCRIQINEISIGGRVAAVVVEESYCRRTAVDEEPWRCSLRLICFSTSKTLTVTFQSNDRHCVVYIGRLARITGEQMGSKLRVHNWKSGILRTEWNKPKNVQEPSGESWTESAELSEPNGELSEPNGELRNESTEDIELVALTLEMEWSLRTLCSNSLLKLFVFNFGEVYSNMRQIWGK